MKKLRLIKPWRLRTVRQHLSNGRSFENDMELRISCCGPHTCFEAVNNPRSINTCNRAEGNISERALYNNAPFSNIICRTPNHTTR